MTRLDLEVRRRTAIKLLGTGISQREVSRMVRCSQASVSRWFRQVVQYGEAGLDPKPKRYEREPTSFTEAQLQHLETLVLSPPKQGYLWTRPRLADAMEKYTGVRVHPTTIGRLLRRRGFSLQKPVRKAYRQDPGKEKVFREQTWPGVKNS